MDVLHLLMDTADEDDGPVLDRIAERHGGLGQVATADYALVQLVNVLSDFLNSIRDRVWRWAA